MGLSRLQLSTDARVRVLITANMFGDLKSAAGVKALNEFLAEHSYIEGFVPSQADTAVFKALSGAPESETAHALRWYNHIKSFAAGMDQFAKASKDASAYVSGGGAAAASKEDDDDDVDLFGSDEESDDEEKKRITEERLKAYHEKKVGRKGKDVLFYFNVFFLR